MYTTPLAPHWLLSGVLNILVGCEVAHYLGVYNMLLMEGVKECLNFLCKFISSINTE